MSAFRRPLAAVAVAAAFIAALITGAGLAKPSEPEVQLRSQGLERSAGWG